MERSKSKWITQFVARQKFRFDIGQGFLMIVNFAFLVIAASPSITAMVHVPAKLLLPVLVPLGIFSVWFLGYVLDKKRFMEAYQKEQNIRNEMMSEVHHSIKK